MIIFFRYSYLAMDDSNSATFKSKKVLTLVYLLDNDNILLGLKKLGFGEGKVRIYEIISDIKGNSMRVPIN